MAFIYHTAYQIDYKTNGALVLCSNMEHAPIISAIERASNIVDGENNRNRKVASFSSSSDGGNYIGHIIIRGDVRRALFTQKSTQTDCVHIKGKTFNSFFAVADGVEGWADVYIYTHYIKCAAEDGE